MEDAEDDDDAMDDHTSDSDADMAPGDGDELVVKRKCDGIFDIALVGEVRSCLSLPLLYLFSLL